MYAVLETGSKQYRVVAGDKLEIERLEVEAGKPVTFDRILPTWSSTSAARKN
jgi:large subunit ribosomal protein L21